MRVEQVQVQQDQENENENNEEVSGEVPKSEQEELDNFVLVKNIGQHILGYKGTNLAGKVMKGPMLRSQKRNSGIGAEKYEESPKNTEQSGGDPLLEQEQDYRYVQLATSIGNIMKAYYFIKVELLMQKKYCQRA